MLSLARRALAVVACLTLLPLSSVHGDAKPEDVKFETSDQVELHGQFYPSTMGKKAPTVLMLHKIGANSQVDGWSKLAESLQASGCAVLTFDFRGHGNSTKVDPNVFWNRAYGNLAGLKVVPSNYLKKDTIAIKDFMTTYYPVLVNDIAAAKLYLDRRNDSGECNSSNLIVIGAEDGATLGLMWIASEAHRFQAIPNPPFAPKIPVNAKAEGKDVSCAIWLSMSPMLGTRNARITDWLKIAGDNKVQMSFIYGADETKDAERAAAYLEVLKPDKSKPFTAKDGIKGTKLAGHKLLSAKLPTEGRMVKYVENFMADNKANDWDKRESDKNVYYWVFGLKSIPAKQEKDKTLAPLPYSYLLP
jgi:alpha-beta hydrolase superfamily lysophospholipase